MSVNPQRSQCSCSVTLLSVVITRIWECKPKQVEQASKTLPVSSCLTRQQTTTRFTRRAEPMQAMLAHRKTASWCLWVPPSSISNSQEGALKIVRALRKPVSPSNKSEPKTIKEATHHDRALRQNFAFKNAALPHLSQSQLRNSLPKASFFVFTCPAHGWNICSGTIRLCWSFD